MSRFFQQVGMGLMAYVNQIRIDRAADALENTTLSIADIGMRVGINDANYFYRLFKKRWGTPKEYRKQHHKTDASM